jgi:hypothetical protein
VGKKRAAAARQGRKNLAHGHLGGEDGSWHGAG